VKSADRQAAAFTDPLRVAKITHTAVFDANKWRITCQTPGEIRSDVERRTDKLAFLPKPAGWLTPDTSES